MLLEALSFCLSSIATLASEKAFWNQRRWKSSAKAFAGGKSPPPKSVSISVIVVFFCFAFFLPPKAPIFAGAGIFPADVYRLLLASAGACVDAGGFNVVEMDGSGILCLV